MHVFRRFLIKILWKVIVKVPNTCKGHIHLMRWNFEPNDNRNDSNNKLIIIRNQEKVD